MSLSRVHRFVLSFALTLLWPATAFAQPILPLSVQSAASTAETKISLDVSSADLSSVIAMLSRQANVKMSVLGTSRMYKPVYVHLGSASLSGALRAIAASAGAKVTQNQDDIYVFSPLSMPTLLPDSFPETPATGYHWRTLVLRHAKPSDVLTLMHWDKVVGPMAPAPFDTLPPAGFAPPPTTLPSGVLRIFALQSNNSLLVEATEEGFATVAHLVTLLDSSPRQVQLHMALVAVPAARADLYTPDVPASRLLPLLLAGESRVISVPTETITDGTTASISIEVPVITRGSRFRLTQIGSIPDGTGPSARCEFRLTPRVNADGTVTLSLTPTTAAPLSLTPAAVPRAVRAGEMVVYEVTGTAQTNGDRLFLFLQPTILSKDGGSQAAGPNSGSSVTVTP